MRLSSYLNAFLLASTLLLTCAPSWAQSASELITKGDLPDSKLQPAEALKFYLPAEKLDPCNVDLMLRIARQYRHLMQDAEKSGEKIQYGDLAKGYAERAVKLDPNNPETHLSVAITEAKMVPMLDNKQKLEASRRMKAEVDQALALDPNHDLAWHLLGCWHQRLAGVGVVMRTLAKIAYGGLPQATNEDAIKCFQQAIKLNPGRLINYIELGRTYAQMGQTKDARRYISKGLGMPNIGKDDPEAKQRGRETIAQL
jgi:tetratricopeptide (TPR) repeat protein